MRLRDSQRSRVYAWERRLFGAEWDFIGSKSPLDLDSCRALVERVWSDYRSLRVPPYVVDGRGSSRARGSRDRIALPRWARVPRVILHEIAHSLDPDGAPHGPHFVRLLIELWARYAAMPRGKALTLAREMRVRVGPLAACEQPKRERRAIR